MAFCWAAGGQSIPIGTGADGALFIILLGRSEFALCNSRLSPEIYGAKAPGHFVPLLRGLPDKRNRPIWGGFLMKTYSSSIALAASIAFCWAAGGQSS